MIDIFTLVCVSMAILMTDPTILFCPMRPLRSFPIRSQPLHSVNLMRRPELERMWVLVMFGTCRHETNEDEYYLCTTVPNGNPGIAMPKR